MGKSSIPPLARTLF